MTCPNLSAAPVQGQPSDRDFEVGLVDEPAVTAAVTGGTGGVDEKRREALHPSVHADMIDVDAPFGQQLLEVAVGQPVAQVPPDRQHDHLWREPVPREGRPIDLR
jgi:hypothetical protein